MELLIIFLFSGHPLARVIVEKAISSPKTASLRENSKGDGHRRTHFHASIHGACAGAADGEKHVRETAAMAGPFSPGRTSIHLINVYATTFCMLFISLHRHMIAREIRTPLILFLPVSASPLIKRQLSPHSCFDMFMVGKA